MTSDVRDRLLIDSGVEWIGAIPAEWGVQQIRQLSPVKRGASPRPIDDPRYFDEDGEWAWVRIADVSASTGRLSSTLQKLSSLGSSLSVKLEPGSLFVSIAGTVGKPCITEIKACVHDGFVYFPDLRFSSEYLFRIFEAGTCYAGLGKMGTQLNLNTDTIGSIRVPVPPSKEQAEIVNFLNVQTAKLDLLIGKQERLIETLAERHQAVVSHAVTKGLDPSAPKKESGVAWLGRIPQHWVAAPMGYLARVETGSRDTVDAKAEGAYPLFVRSQTVERIETYTHDTEAVLTAGDGAGVGKVFHHFSGKFSAHQRVYVMSHFRGVGGRYLFYYFSSLFGKVALDGSAKSTVDSLRRPQLTGFIVTRPPLAEQQAIVKYLDRETAQIDALSAKAREMIEVLKERRQALISAAVTGKIDVRGLS